MINYKLSQKLNLKLNLLRNGVFDHLAIILTEKTCENLHRTNLTLQFFVCPFSIKKQK